ncbi:AraC family transcriptional regulator OS=Streptomyces glaucescens OX=1907 GN=SGLAU_30770 PE=4 SV=1 [Streptomyces glaucescens]
MMKTVLDTTGLPAADRTTARAETVALALVTQRFRFQDPERFGARIRVVELGAVQLSTISHAPLVSYRSGRLIRQSDPEFHQLALTTAGRQGVEQAGHRSALRPGEMALYDSSRPFQGWSEAEPRSSCVLLQFPRGLMPLPDRVVRQVRGTALRPTGGMELVFRQMLTTLAESRAELTGGDRIRLGTTLVDLAAAVVAGHVEETAALPAQSRRSSLYHEMVGFIVRNLSDPGLGPATVAEAHCVSPRTVHRVFQAHGTTVGDVIRRERMSRCRRDLADPHGTRPVSAIGARWGFPRASEFTRAFRAATGMTPTEFRALAQNRF